MDDQIKTAAEAIEAEAEIRQRDRRGARMQLVQHVRQLSAALRALPKVDPKKSANRIGFRLVQDLEDEKDAAAAKNA